MAFSKIIADWVISILPFSFKYSAGAEPGSKLTYCSPNNPAVKCWPVVSSGMLLYLAINPHFAHGFVSFWVKANVADAGRF